MLGFGSRPIATIYGGWAFLGMPWLTGTFCPFGTSNFDREPIINNTVALAKATRVFDVPVVLTTVETQSFSGDMWPKLLVVFPKRTPPYRVSDRECGIYDYWRDARFDELGNAARFSVDEKFRGEAYREMTKIFLEHLPWLPIIQPYED